MTLKEAKKITFTMSGKSIAPPPRRVDDVANIFEKYKADPETIDELRKKADYPFAEDADRIIEFYYERAMAARKIGRVDQWLKDLRSAARLLGGDPSLGRSLVYAVFIELAYAELALNNIDAAVHVLNRLKGLLSEPTPANQKLASIYGRFGYIEEAEKERKEAFSVMAGWGDNEWVPYKKADINASILEAKGRYREAERHRRMALRLRKNLPQLKFKGLDFSQKFPLAEDILYQGRYLEAEIAARDTLRYSIEHFGFRSINTGYAVGLLARIFMRRGDPDEAEKIIKAYSQAMRQAGMSEETPYSVWGKYHLGTTIGEQGKWDEALAQFRLANQYIERFPQVLDWYYFRRNASFPMTLIKTGHSKEAFRLINSSYKTVWEKYGFEHPRDAVIRGLLAVLYTDERKTQDALEYFQKSVPLMIKNRVGSVQERRLVFEKYLDLLYRLKNTQTRDEFQNNTVPESFRVANALQARSVQQALGKHIARSAIQDPALADLARREQDAQNQLDAMQEMLSNHLSAPKRSHNPEIIQNLKNDIDDLRKARDVLQQRIQEQFPRYAELIDPPPVAIQKVKQVLLPEECIIIIHTGEEKTYVWTVSPKGKTRFVVLDLGQEETEKIVTNIRKSLTPTYQAFGGIPDFDLQAAYKLYRYLLKPIENDWKGAKDLLIVAPGPLGQIPFSILPLSVPQVPEQEEILFGRYRKIPWLVRQVSITRLPSVSSFVSLREQQRDTPKRKALAGFGDPLFNADQLARAKDRKEAPPPKTADVEVRLRVRGIRVTNGGSLDSEKLQSCRLDQLTRLPDTAQEIRDIARTLGSDPARDAFLGIRASEKLVKTLDLSDRKVIAFATHALVPGDLDGLLQPAIALSSPRVTGEQGEDGLLKMGEVMKLKLNADWVLLSACNTGAAEGKGAEAVSGLGRAFFYAGARALLVSMWPVESTSARELTTGIFRHQKENPDLSRAGVLRQSILDMIDKKVFRHGKVDKVVASYAHPFFWAPFIVVGDAA